MDYNPTTKLEAVNQLLSMIQERQVNSLTNPPADVALAISILDEIAVNVQSGNWYFNTDPCVKYSPDTDGDIKVATNVIRVNPDKGRNYPHLPVLRTGRRQLYDKYDQTYTFTKDMYLDVTYLLDWEDLPQPVRAYIVARAGRVYNDRALNDPDLKQSLLISEQLARQELGQWDSDEADDNIFDDPQVARMLYRHNSLDRLAW